MTRLDSKPEGDDPLETSAEVEGRQEEPQKSLLGSRRRRDESRKDWKDWRETETETGLWERLAETRLERERLITAEDGRGKLLETAGWLRRLNWRDGEATEEDGKEKLRRPESMEYSVSAVRRMSITCSRA